VDLGEGPALLLGGGAQHDELVDLDAGRCERSDDVEDPYGLDDDDRLHVVGLLGS
jgi:hypothetical protein